MVKKVTDKKMWSCQRKDCQFKSQSKFQFKVHQKGCAFKKRKRGRFSSKKNFGQVDLSRAKIGQKIGKGFFGTVFAARVGNLQMVAKYVDSKESFMTQKKTYEKIQQQKKNGFPCFFGSFEEKGLFVLFLEKLDFTIQKFFNKVFHLLSEKSVAKIMLKIIQKIQHLHECGFVHRDLKFNNIMMKNGQIFITDFGTCRQIPKHQIKSSVYGSIRYMSLDCHQFQIQTYKDDLQSIGWLFLQLTRRNLPWQKQCQLYKQGKVSFNDATSLVFSSKQKFLKSTKIKSFVVDYLKIASQLPFDQDKNKNQSLKDAIRKFINSSNERDQKWNRLYQQENNEYCGGWKCVSKIMPTFQIRDFDESMLPFEITRKYMKKEKLSVFQIMDVLVEHCRAVVNKAYFYCDLTTSSFKNRAQQETPKLWLIFSDQEETGPHFSTYISRNGNLLSFNGIPQPEQVSRLPVKNWKYVSAQKDNWSCGYRAIFWMMNVLESQNVSKWLANNEVQL